MFLGFSENLTQVESLFLQGSLSLSLSLYIYIYIYIYIYRISNELSFITKFIT